MKFGLEALSETVERHQEGRYNTQNIAKKAYGAGSGHKYSGEDFAFQFSQQTSDLRSSQQSARQRATTQEESLLFGHSSMQSRVTSGKSKLGISQLASGIFNKKRGSSNLKLSGSPSKASKIRERLRASRLGV